MKIDSKAEMKDKVFATKANKGMIDATSGKDRAVAEKQILVFTSSIASCLSNTLYQV